jgi:hypothetical protein
VCRGHAGSYSWEIKVGASASSKIGFWGATPVVQPSGADQAAVTLGNSDDEIGGLTISDPRTSGRMFAVQGVAGLAPLFTIPAILESRLNDRHRVAHQGRHVRTAMTTLFLLEPEPVDAIARVIVQYSIE